MNFKHMLKSTEKLIVDNSPLILTAIGVTGTLTTAYLTGKASYRAFEVLEGAKLQKNRERHSTGEPFKQLETREKLELTWKLYVPAVGSAALTIAAIVGANRVGTRRAAAMAAAYSLSEKAYSEYRDKVVEQIGKTKEAEVRQEIIKDRVSKDKPPLEHIVQTNGGSDWCYDKFSGRYFMSSMETIKGAQNHINYQLNNNQYASLNDFYEWIGLNTIPMGEELGWRTPNNLELMFTLITSEDGHPCHAFEFWTAPIRNFHKNGG